MFHQVGIYLKIAETIPLLSTTFFPWEDNIPSTDCRESEASENQVVRLRRAITDNCVYFFYSNFSNASRVDSELKIVTKKAKESFESDETYIEGGNDLWMRGDSVPLTVRLRIYR